MGQSQSTQEAIVTSQGSRIDCQSIEIFKFGVGLKLAKPSEFQGFFLVVPIIPLSLYVPEVFPHMVWPVHIAFRQQVWWQDEEMLYRHLSRPHT